MAGRNDFFGFPESCIITLFSDITKTGKYGYTVPSDVYREMKRNRVSISENLFFNLAKSPNREVREALAEREDLPKELFETLARDESFFVYKAMAEREDLPDELLVEIIENSKGDYSHSSILHTAAERKNLPDAISTMLVNDKDKRVRAALARKDDLSEHLVTVFAEDEDEDVRRLAVDRDLSNFSDGLLILKFAKSKYPDVRQIIARREDLTEGLFDDLAEG